MTALPNAQEWIITLLGVRLDPMHNTKLVYKGVSSEKQQLLPDLYLWDCGRLQINTSSMAVGQQNVLASNPTKSVANNRNFLEQLTVHFLLNSSILPPLQCLEERFKWYAVSIILTAWNAGPNLQAQTETELREQYTVGHNMITPM